MHSTKKTLAKVLISTTGTVGAGVGDGVGDHVGAGVKSHTMPSSGKVWIVGSSWKSSFLNSAVESESRTDPLVPKPPWSHIASVPFATTCAI